MRDALVYLFSISLMVFMLLQLLPLLQASSKFEEKNRGLMYRIYQTISREGPQEIDGLSSMGAECLFGSHRKLSVIVYNYSNGRWDVVAKTEPVPFTEEEVMYTYVGSPLKVVVRLGSVDKRKVFRWFYRGRLLCKTDFSPLGEVLLVLSGNGTASISDLLMEREGALLKVSWGGKTNTSEVDGRIVQLLLRGGELYLLSDGKVSEVLSGVNLNEPWRIEVSELKEFGVLGGGDIFG